MNVIDENIIAQGVGECMIRGGLEPVSQVVRLSGFLLPPQVEIL